MSGKLVTIRPDGTSSFAIWPKSGTPEWRVLADSVGGYIERVRVHYDGKVRDAYVNEDGISQGLPVNKPATALLAHPFYPDQNTLLGCLVIWVPDPVVRKGPKRKNPDGSVSS